MDIRIGHLAKDLVLALGMRPGQVRQVQTVRSHGAVVGRRGPVHLDGRQMVPVVVRRPAQHGVDRRFRCCGRFDHPPDGHLLVEEEALGPGNDQIQEAFLEPGADVHAQGEVRLLGRTHPDGQAQGFPARFTEAIKKLPDLPHEICEHRRFFPRLRRLEEHAHVRIELQPVHAVPSAYFLDDAESLGTHLIAGVVRAAGGSGVIGMTFSPIIISG